MQDKLVSIITITYNSASTLRDSLRSVEAQNYEDIEHIIIDGASTDGTQAIIQAYARDRQQVHYVSEKDTGIYNAINKGLRLATGDIIGILNSDDVLASPDTIATIVHRFSHDDAQVVYGDLVYCNTMGAVVRHWRSNTFRRSSLKFGWMPAHPTFYCLRSVYEQIGQYDETFAISADYDFMLRVLLKPYRIVYIPKILVRMGMGGVSNRGIRALLSKSNEYIRILRKNHVGVSLLTVFLKNIRKTHQFFRRTAG